VFFVIDFAAAIPFYLLWNWLFTKFFSFDFIDIVESMGFVAIFIMMRLIIIDTRYKDK
jgi:hypothetical protein